MIPLTVVSYNIHRGVGLDRRLDLDRIADVIAETAPDVVGLQEVIREAGGKTGDQGAYLALKLGMALVMGVTRAHGSGTYGNAVLTRVPVLGSERRDLSRGAREPRGALRVDLDVKGTPLHVFNCHLGLALSERRAQLELLGRFIRNSARRSEEHTSELQSPCNLVCRLLLEKKKVHLVHPDRLDHLHLLDPSAALSLRQTTDRIS